jgi:hypothetical protein
MSLTAFEWLALAVLTSRCVEKSKRAIRTAYNHFVTTLWISVQTKVFRRRALRDATCIGGTTRPRALTGEAAFPEAALVGANSNAATDVSVIGSTNLQDGHVENRALQVLRIVSRKNFAYVEARCGL